jgi:crotonobetainyl-CoA:carnitine CoA-transferase CaiB-like acyl-CoA transferase
VDDTRFDTVVSRAGLALPDGGSVSVVGEDPVLPARHPIAEAAAVALALAGAAAADIHRLRTGTEQHVTVAVRAAAASLLSFAHQRLDGAATPRTNAGNPTVAFYQCGAGGWIHLHGGFPKLKAGTLALLGCGDDAGEIAKAVKGWDALELEDALAARGLCGARARTPEEWAAHEQGRALSEVPAVEMIRIGDAEPQPLPAADRPLRGVRVLDLTRVLAGPTCGRTLAEHGADVLRVSSPNLPSVPPFVMDTGHGKRSCFLDLDRPEEAARLRELAATADVFSQGYRSGALDRRGFGPRQLAEDRPGIVYVSIDCYGHVGPWATRPGWEQLAQTASGIATVEGSPERPQLFPAAATDYTTGYLAALGTMLALAKRSVEGGSWWVRASLCQTARWLQRLGPTCDPAAASGTGDIDRWMTTSDTPQGRLRHLRPVTDMSVTQPRWELPTVPLGSHPPEWV